jgi:hypothetical protein
MKILTRGLLIAIMFVCVPALAFAMTLTYPGYTPNGWVFNVGQSRTITWSSGQAEGQTARIEMSGSSALSGMSGTYTVVSAAPNNGAYAWTVGNLENGSMLPSGNYSMKICTSSNICDIAGPIEIDQGVTLRITGPTSSATWTQNSSDTVTWSGNTTLAGDTIAIYLTGGPYSTQYSFASLLPNTGSFTGSLANFSSQNGNIIPAGTYGLRVCFQKSNQCDIGGVTITVASAVPSYVPPVSNCAYGGCTTGGTITPSPSVVTNPTPVVLPTAPATPTTMTDAAKQQMIMQLQTLLAQLIQQLIQLLQQQPTVH